MLRLQEILTVSHNHASTKKHLTVSFSGTSKFRKAVRCFHNHCSGERSMVWTRSSQSTRLVSNCAYTILDPYSFYLKTNIKWNFYSILIENEVNITNSTYRRPKGCELYLKGFSKLRVNTNTGNLPGLKISNARWSQLQMVYLLQNLSRHLYRILGNVGQTKFGQLHHQYLALE